MRRLTRAGGALLTLVAATVCLAAQAGVQQQSPPKVAVLEFSSRANFRRPDWDQPAAYRMTRGILTAQRQEVAKQYVYKVKIQNTGPKTITAVEWDYVFIDPTTQTEVARHRFRSRQQIRPGRKGTLEGRSNTPPTRNISVKAPAEHPFTERVIVSSVSYAEEGAKAADNR